MDDCADIGRRRALVAGAGAVVVGTFGSAGRAFAAQEGVATVAGASPAAKPLPSYVSWKDAPSLIVHSSNTIETKRTAFGTSVITPSERLYIRNNLPPPPASFVEDRDA